jgi:excisionase family DNA binding protein
MTEKTYVEIGKVADYFGISVSTTRKWLHEGHIPRETYIKAGDTYRFNVEAIEKALTSRKELNSRDSEKPTELSDR